MSGTSGNDDRKIQGDITPDGYSSVPRARLRGGGIELLHEKSLSVTSVTDEATNTIASKSLSACVTCGSKTLRLIIICRLIPFQKRGPKHSDFVMEFSNLIERF